MAAGTSADEMATTALARAEQLEREAVLQRELAGRMSVAARTEHRTARTLGHLTALGYCFLTDRSWPGGSAANVDLVAIGPGGVFILDTKCWAQTRVTDGRIFRREQDVTGDLTSMVSLLAIARSELADVGLPPALVIGAVVLAGRSGAHGRVSGLEVVGEREAPAFVARHGTRLDDRQVDVLVRRCQDLFPPRPRRAAEPQQPLLREPDDEVQEALITPDELEVAIREGLAAAPVESWMTWLHPDQAPYVRRSYNGPVRIRGAAGTGKTVLGLHRAAWIASTRPGKVLVTSFVRTLPATLKAQYARLSPQTAERVDFVSAHQFALDLLRERGTPLTVERAAIDAAYRVAWARVGKPGPLKRLPVGWEYWKDEIAHVIKGRAIFEFDDYARLERVGRRYRLGVEQRLAVWELLLAYQQELQARAVYDFADVFIYAEQALRAGPVPPYTAVVVDEVQDLPCVALRMFHHLVHDRPDALLLIGDGQQSIYPGGFTLREAGIDVRGRAVVMRHNYRNTEEILTAAQTIVSGDAFSDLDDLDEVGDRDVVATRRGAAPVSQVLPDLPSHEAAFLAAVRQALDHGASQSDIAVLVPTNPMADRYLAQLEAVGIAAVSLTSSHARPSDRVTVGTYHRSKGMEFRHVFLPQVMPPTSPRRDETEDAYRERVELDRRTLFVAMTRARDTLWVGHVAPTLTGA